MQLFLRLPTRNMPYSTEKVSISEQHAVFDARYRFLHIDVGAKGKENDSTVFKRSSFGKALEVNRLPVPGDKELPNTSCPLPHVFIGDEAFPLKTNFLKPFSRYVDLTTDKKNLQLQTV
ncbi:hypothetical protein QYM36_017496 [Artemia franciscana]|uniref:DDE Tnp4 domain-containing protein n=1 Tax=Artemia franciscana TaxID=6661 RepID=A0AA88H3Y0_ARTSF|nr:hypothetical protein QYM36_017496 [Artemia franciscana]